jgi:plastocyanin
VLLKSRIAHGIASALLLNVFPWTALCAELTVQVRDRLNAPVAYAAVLAEPLDPPTSARKATVDSGATMKQSNRQFGPHALIVAPGTAVQFPNVDTVRHHVYSLSPAKRFELRLYSGTPAQPVVFDTPGIAVLGCNIHDWMAAFVYVTPAPYHALTDEAGSATLADLPPGRYQLSVWHPQRVDVSATDPIVALGAGSPQLLSITVQLEGAVASQAPASALEEMFHRYRSAHAP